MSLQFDNLSEGKRQSARKCTPTGKCTQEVMFKMCIPLGNYEAELLKFVTLMLFHLLVCLTGPMVNLMHSYASHNL